MSGMAETREKWERVKALMEECASSIPPGGSRPLEWSNNRKAREAEALGFSSWGGMYEWYHNLNHLMSRNGFYTPGAENLRPSMNVSECVDLYGGLSETWGNSVWHAAGYGLDQSGRPIKGWTPPKRTPKIYGDEQKDVFDADHDPYPEEGVP